MTTNAAGHDSPPLDRESFARMAEPYRPALKLHCYRMLGSLHEAEDAVQDTFVRAWTGIEGFEGRATFKNWLFRIATNTCLNALASRARRRRFLPEQLGRATATIPSGEQELGVLWLEPYPDSEIEGIADAAPGPEARYEMRESIRLAFVAAVQQLPPRQRAVLMLVDVMGWPAQEAATLLETSLASVNSALQRAREKMRSLYGSLERQTGAVADRAQRDLIDRYLRAWESKDLDGFVALLKDDAKFAMPPRREWYEGRDSIRRFFASVWGSYDGFRLVLTGANGEPAFGLYSYSKAEGLWKAHSLQLLSIRDGRIAALTAFLQPLSPRLFEAFRLPQTLPASNAPD
ncbi:MAG TPA: RNA polymerase subunit sigma-70 [Roseiarcus sp.]|jgi:RNA polymerase sigma-70 factor (ECF subfamily)